MGANGRPVLISAAAACVAMLSCASLAQSPAQSPANATPAVQGQATDPAPAGQWAGAQTGQSAGSEAVAVPGPAAPAKRIYTVPAGTKVLLTLRSAVNTKSARPGDGVYLASAFPVVVGNRVMIPAGVYVQGVVDRVERAGRVKGRAQLDMHFTSIIYPNGTVVQIPGLVDSLPGAKKQEVKEGGEGTIEQDGDKTRNMGKTAEVAIPTGATVGSIAGLGSGHPLAGGLTGVGAGLAAAGIVALFTRGADVNIESGTQVEMVLQRPLLLEDANLTGAGTPGAVDLIPTPDQPKPLDKPKRARVLCPPGGLGCE